jgi:hypothetical protein
MGVKREFGPREKGNRWEMESVWQGEGIVEG